MEDSLTQLPEQSYNPGITAEDIPTPWLLFAQGQTKADVEYGSLYTAMGSQTKQIAAPAAGSTGAGESVRFHVLRGPIKRWGIINEFNETWVRDGYEEAAALPNVKTGPFRVFDYVIALPDVDDRLPYKIRFKRTGADAAKDINMALLFAGPGNESSVAFDLSLEKVVDEFKYVVPHVSVVEVPALEAAKTDEVLEKLRPLAGSPEPTRQLPQTTSNVPVPGSAPALD